MHIFIMRHGLAERSSEQGDAGRRLTEEGREQVAAAVRGWQRLPDVPQRVVCSPFERTVATAGIITEVLALPDAQILPTLAAGAMPDEIFAELSGCLDRPLAIVGHMPDVSYLTAYLTGDNADQRVRFQPGSVAAVSFGGEPSPQTGTLSWFRSSAMLASES